MATRVSLHSRSRHADTSWTQHRVQPKRVRFRGCVRRLAPLVLAAIITASLLLQFSWTPAAHRMTEAAPDPRENVPTPEVGRLAPSAWPHPPASLVPPSPPEAAGVDLDVRYAADPDAWWESSTPPAWLVQTRASMLAKDTALHGTTPKQLPPVPHKIHQTWKDKVPPKQLFSARWRQALQTSNPGWRYRLWTDAENRALVATRYPWFLSIYDGYPTPIQVQHCVCAVCPVGTSVQAQTSVPFPVASPSLQAPQTLPAHSTSYHPLHPSLLRSATPQRSDAARYFIAHAHGGLYADLDIECFRPLGPLLRPGTSLLLSYKQGNNFSRGACNSIFASVAAHPFWDVVFDVLRNRSTIVPRGHNDILFTTGVVPPSTHPETRLPASRAPPPHPVRHLHPALPSAPSRPLQVPLCYVRRSGEC